MLLGIWSIQCSGQWIKLRLKWFSRRVNRYLRMWFFCTFWRGNTQAFSTITILICKNGCMVWLHHYSISNFGKDEILDVCFLILALIHIECDNSILMHLIVRKLLGFVVFLDVLWPYILVEAINLNSLVVGHTWFWWSRRIPFGD